MRGFTVELSVIMPMIMAIIMTSVLALFYSHDKNIISGTAYETVVIGANCARKREGVTADRLEAIFRERLGDKCLFFADTQVVALVDEDEAKITVIAEKRGMKLSVEKSMRLTQPEKKIREIKKIKEVDHGKDNTH